MQDMIRERVRALLDEGMGSRVLGWERGESFYDRSPVVLGRDELDRLVYDSFCGCNLSKYLIQESAKEGRTIVLIKPCDSYSLNQLCTERRTIPLHPLQRLPERLSRLQLRQMYL